MKIHGERGGTRALIEVLLLGRHMTHEHVVACTIIETGTDSYRLASIRARAEDTVKAG
ncbi:hypothetical protein [Streptomyces sp. NPDC004788]